MANANVLWIFFPIAITLHNLEEAIWMPRWSLHAKRFRKPVEPGEFHFGIIVVTMLAYLSCFLAVTYPSLFLFKHIFFGFLGAMILNAFIPHLGATIVFRRYSPGLLTGLLLLVPINSILVVKAIVSGDLQWFEFFSSTAVVAVVLLTLLPFLFRFGKRLIDY